MPPPSLMEGFVFQFVSSITCSTIILFQVIKKHHYSSLSPQHMLMKFMLLTVGLGDEPVEESEIVV
jgi:hypothetical protein